ncbi:hypothetical protein [Sphingomicrobium arenosum]|uniref:hypothetical protein n=1 Tax=Sphingomicrobium arenosum TaxID=2233861 RepID=UPI00223F2BC7|nr:hypothetical protein [Sphingomicrobium arenosum]
MVRATVVGLILYVIALSACGREEPPIIAPEDRGVIIPIEVDGTLLHVPKIWAQGDRRSPRPWPNGVTLVSGGWGASEPRLGPIAIADTLPPGTAYRFDSSGQQNRPGNPDPFFALAFTFEFALPLPERTWWGGTRAADPIAFGSDMMRLRYRAPVEVTVPPYVAMLEGLTPEHGAIVG